MVFPRLSSEMSFCVWRRASAPADCVPPPGGGPRAWGRRYPAGTPDPVRGTDDRPAKHHHHAGELSASPKGGGPFASRRGRGPGGLGGLGGEGPGRRGGR